MAEDYPKARNPLILRYHRLLEAFSKSDDERDFYFDRVEGFLLYLDLDKTEEELTEGEKEIKSTPDRYCLVPKLTYYETKKFMEGFVNEKVYDIDTKEKLLDIIGSKEARENFLEFIYDHLTELDKWQQYYHERSRIRIIEYLRKWNIIFVFEEDLELSKNVVEKLKEHLFTPKVSKEVQQARDLLEAKAKTYYSNEALNPRPKRGRPPKQQLKIEMEPELADDIYTTTPLSLRCFLFLPEYSSNAATFSSKFENEAQLLASLKGSNKVKVDSKLEVLSQRLESLRHISHRLKEFRPTASGAEEKKTSITASAEVIPESESKLSKVAMDLLPKKRGRPTKKEMIEEKKKGVKQVTQIKYNWDKKK
ncbi:MAG: UPF0158 family protein [Verrucomicrobia bacterium]|jgi:hypothetical protein|nr:UPF0158 family protein [Verrucomicrobiota bacterium]